MTEQARTRRVATWISEVGGPAPLLFVGLLEVGLRAGSVWPTFVAATTMAALPYAVMIWLARSGKVTDRFVRERRHRTPVLTATLVVFVLGAVAAMLLGAPARLMLVIGVAIAALVIVTAITLVWKISIHATLASFFAALQVYLFGWWGLLAFVLLAAVLWSRRVLRAHTNAQLAAGAALGLLLLLSYVWLVHL